MELSNTTITQSGEMICLSFFKVSFCRDIIKDSDFEEFLNASFYEQNLLIDSYIFSNKLYFVGLE